MNVGDRVTVLFVTTNRRERVERRARVRKVDPVGDRVQVRCDESMPYPAVWDFRKLMTKQPVFLIRDGEQFVGRWSGAAGRNLTLSDVHSAGEGRPE